MWIVNASPLILLGKIGRLDVLPVLAGQLIVPQSVAREISVGPPRDPAALWLNSAGRLWVAQPCSVDSRVLAWDLGAGETEVLSRALVAPDALCVLDDRAARDCAAVFGLRVIGSVGVLVRAKRANLIPAMRPEIEALRSAGALLADHVVSECLRLAGESP